MRVARDDDLVIYASDEAAEMSFTPCEAFTASGCPAVTMREFPTLAGCGTAIINFEGMGGFFRLFPARFICAGILGVMHLLKRERGRCDELFHEITSWLASDSLSSSTC